GDGGRGAAVSESAGRGLADVVRWVLEQRDGDLGGARNPEARQGARGAFYLVELRVLRVFHRGGLDEGVQRGSANAAEAVRGGEAGRAAHAAEPVPHEVV